VSYRKGTIPQEHVYTLAQLEAMPTLHQGQADDCKVVTPTINVWLSRCDIYDGEPCNNKVTIEELQDGCWVEVCWYEAV
jgi:hypothetical protein